MGKKRKPVGKAMTRDEFLAKLQAHSATFAKAVGTNEGDWIIKGFIDMGVTRIPLPRCLVGTRSCDDAGC
jgi:hypothetical protein